MVEPVFFEPDLFKRLNPLITHLSKKTGLAFQLLIPENVEDFIDMQNKGEGAIFLQNPHLYTKMTESNRVRGVASIAETGSPEGRMGIIITNSSGRIKTPKDLADKKIGITSFSSDDGYLSQKDLLLKEGVPLDSLSFIKLKTYENVIMKVYRGSVDAGFVSLSALWSMEQDIDMTKIPKDIRCSFKIKELYVAALCDDCTRLTYAEILKDKKASTLTYFMARSLSWFKQIYNFEFEAVMSDNGPEFKGSLEREHPFETMCNELGIKHICTKPYRPQTNGKVEAFWPMARREDN